MNERLGDRLKRWLLAEPPAVAGQEPVVDAREIGGCAPRERVRVAGRLHGLHTDPERGWFEADLADGTGTVRLVWMGRASLACVAEGTRLVAEGRMTTRDGALVVYNPDFVVLPG